MVMIYDFDDWDRDYEQREDIKKYDKKEPDNRPPGRMELCLYQVDDFYQTNEKKTE